MYNERKYTNHLINQKSKYLLKHAHSQINWYPWGSEALERAKEEKKLIFLSIGYLTCHWCYVMEAEVFQNETVADYMNQNFVNIKVDRDERPDLDKIYLVAAIVITGDGGWPLSLWLTPNLIPVYAGTYLPHISRFQMPSYLTVSKKMCNAWKTKQHEVFESEKKVLDCIIKSFTKPSCSINDESKIDPMDIAIYDCKLNFDHEHCGFGQWPKFPEVPRLNFLLDVYAAKKDPELLDMALSTLRKISNSGLRDHLGGGFSRYSVDREWRVPRFEKMLYDQALLIIAFSNAYKLTLDEFYLDIADKTCRYMMNHLRSPSGGFCAGESADSYPSYIDNFKVEGAFYLWEWLEVREAIYLNASKFKLDPETVFKIYCHHYDIHAPGNIPLSSDPSGAFVGKNILFIRDSFEETCDSFSLHQQSCKQLIERVNDTLCQVRNNRPRPELDNKIITSWNGLVLSALVKLSKCGGSAPKEYLWAGRHLIDFLQTYCFDVNKRVLLRSCFCKGSGFTLPDKLAEPVEGFLDDYAFVIRGLLEFYKETMNVSVLQWAKELQDIQDSEFWDDEHGAYFYNREDPGTLLRIKEDHDAAVPCANSVAARNLFVFSAFFTNSDYCEKARRLLDYYKTTERFGYVLPEMMSAYLMKDQCYEDFPDAKDITMKILNVQFDFDFLSSDPLPV